MIDKTGIGADRFKYEMEDTALQGSAPFLMKIFLLFFFLVTRAILRIGQLSLRRQRDSGRVMPLPGRTTPVEFSTLLTNLRPHTSRCRSLWKTL